MPYPANWNETEILRFMVGQHTPDLDQDPYLSKFLGNGDAKSARSRIWHRTSPRKLVALVKEMGAEVFYFYAKCNFGNAYYPSKVGHVHSLTGGRDLFGEMVEECLKNKIVPAALYEFSDLRVKEEKPEWCFRSADGTVALPCMNSPYGDFALRQIAEIWGNQYPIAALFVDMLDFHIRPGWKCPWCEPLYKKATGRKMINENEMTLEERSAYHRWVKEQVRNYLLKLNALKDELAPRCELEHNFHGLYTGHWDHPWKDTRDLTGGFNTDIFAYQDGSVIDVFAAKAYRRARPDHRSFILQDTSHSVVPFVPSILDCSTPRPFDFYLEQAASLLANGVAFCSSIFIEWDGTMDPTQARVIKNVNAYFKPRKPYFLETEQVAFAGLLLPSQSREFMKEKAWLYDQEFGGWVRLLLENHVLFDVLVDELMTEELLSRYKLLILPNAEALSDRQVRMIDAFTRKGGALIATGSTSLADAEGRERKNFGLKETLGVSLAEPLAEGPTYALLKDRRFVDPDKTISPWIFLPDGQTRVRKTGETKIVATLADKPPALLSYLRHETSFPAITIHPCHSGRACYWAGLPGLTYAKYQYPGLARLMGKLVQNLTGNRMPVQVDTPASVQVEVTRQNNPKRTIIHLINHTGNSNWTVPIQKEGSSVFGASFFSTGQPHEVLPVNGVKIKVRQTLTGKPGKIYLAPQQTPLPFQENNGWIHLALERLERHEMIVIEETPGPGKKR